MSVVLALDRRTGFTWPESCPYPLRPWLLATWAVVLTTGSVGLVRTSPLSPLIGVALIFGCMHLLPRSWWRGVRRMSQEM